MAAEIGHRMQHDALAGSASVALAASDVKGAMALAERLLTVLAPNEQDGADLKPRPAPLPPSAAGSFPT